MVYILDNNRNDTYGVNSYAVDTKIELRSVLLSQCAPGSTAYVKSEGKKYIKTTNGTWIIKPNSEGGGSSPVDLTGYATEAWVSSQGFLKPSALSAYASKQWVTEQIRTNAYTELKPITQYLYDYYVGELDEEYARDFFSNSSTNQPLGACSAVRRGNLYGRNFDWTYDNSVEFIIHSPRIGSRNAVLGVSGSIVGLTDEFVSSGAQSDLYKIVPFRMVDGINEHGMVMNTNVVPNQKSESTFATPLVSEEYELPASMMIFYVLSNFKTVNEAVNYLRDHVKIVIPQTMLDQDFFLHWMLADKEQTILLEIIDGQLVISDMTPNTNSRLSGKSYLTNFYLSDITFNNDGTVTTPATGNAVEVNGITSHGAGLERYNIIVNMFDNITDKNAMHELLSAIRYTNAYQNNMGGNWYSEFVGLMDLDLTSPLEAFEEAFPYAAEAFENRTRGDGTWQTTHSCIYDIDEGKLYITSQEQFDDEYEFAIELNKPIVIPDPVTYTAGYGIVIDGNNNISIDEVDIATVEYVDANISDTMNFIIQERDNEHAGRVAGDNLLQAAINNKQDTLIAGTGIEIAEDGKTISATGSSGGGDSSIIPINEAIPLICSVEDPWAEELTPDDVFYSCDINASAVPVDFWVHPSRYNFIVTIESTDEMIWGYTANHFCYMLDNYEGNWGITAVCEDNINQLNVKHDTTITKDTSEEMIHIVYQGFIEDSPSLPVEGNICSVYLQKLS